MKNMLWFAAGIAVGFAAAHQFNKTEPGREFFAGVNAKARAFGEAIAEGYHERDTELRAAKQADAASAD